MGKNKNTVGKTTTKKKTNQKTQNIHTHTYTQSKE